MKLMQKQALAHGAWQLHDWTCQVPKILAFRPLLSGIKASIFGTWEVQVEYFDTTRQVQLVPASNGPDRGSEQGEPEAP